MVDQFEEQLVRSCEEEKKRKSASVSPSDSLEKSSHSVELYGSAKKKEKAPL